MAKTITSMVMDIVKSNSPNFVSTDELYNLALRFGYKGQEEKILQTAERLADRGTLDSIEGGRATMREYRAPLEVGI